MSRTAFALALLLSAAPFAALAQQPAPAQPMQMPSSPAAGGSPSDAAGQEFMAEMQKMQQAMPKDMSGDVDVQFIEMMIPHHQGAVDMAQTYLKYGQNKQLTKLAERIVKSQQREIALMQRILDRANNPRANRRKKADQ